MGFPSSKTIETRFEQPVTILLPIFVILFGIVNEVSSVQLAKAFDSILVTLYTAPFLVVTVDGITMSPVYFLSK